MQTEKLPIDNQKQFYDNQGTHQINIYASPNLLKDNNFNLEGYYRSRYFLNPKKIYHLRINNLLLDDEPFYHIRILHFSITISASAVIKAKNITHITPSIIQKIQQLNIQSSGLKLVKLSYLFGSVDQINIYFRMTSLLPTY